MSDEKCAVCGRTEPHPNCLEEYNAAIAARNQGMEDAIREPTVMEIGNACLAYRHDFGLLTEDDAANVWAEAKAWHEAWAKVWEDKIRALMEVGK